MRKFSLLLLMLTSVLCSPVSAHNYFAPYLYLSGIYSPTGEPVNYPPASDSEMNWLLQQVKDKDANIRAIAAGALGQSNNPKSIEPLLQALGDDHSSVVMNAQMAFFHVRDPRVIKALKGYLPCLEMAGLIIYSLAAQGDEGINVIMDALTSKHDLNIEAYYLEVADALILSRNIDAFKWATDTLSKPDSNKHLVAILILRNFYLGDMKNDVCEFINNPGITDILLKAAGNDNGNYTKDAALELLRCSKDPRAQTFIKAEVAEREKNSYSEEEEEEVRPINLNDKKIKQYATHIRNAKGKQSSEANLDANEEAEQLARTPNPKGIETLIKILNEKNATAARMATRALAFSKNPKAIAALTPILINTKHLAYKETIDYLVHSGNKAIDIKLLQSKDPYAVKAKISALSCDNDYDLAKYLIPLLKKPGLKLDAAFALARFKDPVAIDTLVNSLRDKKILDSTRTAIIDALSNYGQPVINKLLPELTDSNSGVRIGVASFFSSNKESRAVDPLITLLDDSNVKVRRAAINALIFQNDNKAAQYYIIALKDKDLKVRKSACAAVALSPTQSAVGTLSSLLNDKDKYMQTCAAIALGELGDNRGANLVIDYLTKTYTDEDNEEDEEIEESEAGNGSEVEEKYDQLLTVAAIRAAGKLKEKRAVGPITNSLVQDVKMSVFDSGTEDEMKVSREAKLEALRSITAQDFGYAFYRWMAWSIAQGNKPMSLFSNMESEQSDEMINYNQE